MKHYLKGLGGVVGVLAVVAVLVLGSVPVGRAHAATFRGNDAYSLRKGDNIDGNFYAAGGNVSIEGDVNGDLVTGAGTILVSGNVKDDVLAGGGTVQVLGTVGGDVRIAGGTITIGSEVGGEVVITGGNVTFLSSAHIGKDVTVLGGTIILDGEIGGAVKIRGGSVTLNGKMDKDVDIAAQNVKLGGTAVILGNLNYKAPTEVQIATGGQIKGDIHYAKIENNKKGQDVARATVRGILGAWFVLKLLMLLVAALMLVWLAKPYLQHVSDQAKNSFGKELVRGLVVGIVMPIAAIILCVTVIGVIPGVMVGLAYVLVLMLAKATAGILLGAWLERIFDKKTEHRVSWRTAVSGVIALALLMLIPIIGWIIGAVLCLAAFGAWWHVLAVKFHGHAAA